MNVQQIIALAIVAIAALFLGRRFVTSLRAFLRNEGGCVKCGFAARLRAGLSTDEARRAAGIMPLSDRRSGNRASRN